MTGQDGVILLTCQPHNTEFFARMAESGLAIAFIHRRVNGYRTTSVEMEVRSALAGDALQQFVEIRGHLRRPQFGDGLARGGSHRAA